MIYTAIYTDRGGRDENEDTVRIRRQSADEACLVVADGLGGHGGGSIASAAAAQTITENWQGSADPNELSALVQKAHRAVCDAQSQDCSMKSTVAVLALSGGRAAWAHVGDTRLYRFENSKLVFQTRDHSASQVAVVLGDISPEQIRFHEDRNRILRALGQEDDLKVETAACVLAAWRCAFLLCTDGFWEYVLESEMEADLQAADNPQDWLDRMRARLNARVPADHDNHTAAAVWLEQE